MASSTPSPTSQAAGEPVAWLIRWPNGNAEVFMDLEVAKQQAAMFRTKPVPLGVISTAPTTGSAPGAHFDDRAVDEFARLMKQKMDISRANGRYGWDDPDECSIEDLTAMLHESVAKGDPVDVANFCMMLRHYDAKIAAPASRAASVLSDDARECLMDVVSHYDNIRAGFRAQEMEAFNAQDSDSAAYWVREIKVLERMKEQAERALLAASMGGDES